MINRLFKKKEDQNEKLIRKMNEYEEKKTKQQESKVLGQKPVKGKVVGGYYFRAFDLIKFMKLVEKEEGEVVGLEFEDNNVNVIIKDEPYIDAYRKTNKTDGKAE